MPEQKTDKKINEVLSQVAYQMKEAMMSMHAAMQRVAPPEARDADAALDDSAAILNQSYFRLRRLAANLEAAADLDAPALPLQENDDIVGLCRAVTDRAQHSAEILGITLSFRSERASHIIAVDAGRVERMLLNLLSNAFKFTPAGGSITVEVRVDDRRVEIRVSDTGRGITPEQMEDLFDRYRTMNFPTGTERGLGLGLPISRKIAEDHGGSLVVLSGESGGVTVVASLENRKTTNLGMKTLIASDYSGGFNKTILELSDALPRKAFLNKMMD